MPYVSCALSSMQDIGLNVSKTMRFNVNWSKNPLRNMKFQYSQTLSSRESSCMPAVIAVRRKTWRALPQVNIRKTVVDLGRWSRSSTQLTRV